MKIEKQNTTIEIFDDYVVKHLKNKTKTQGWYESYLEFSADNPLYVKILDFEPSKLILEKIDIVSPVNDYLKNTENLNRDLCLHICESYFKVILDCIEYSKQEKDIYWTHDDLTIDNFVITTNNQVKLIDPDSFHFCDNPMDYKYSFGTIELENLMRRLT